MVTDVVCEQMNRFIVTLCKPSTKSLGRTGQDLIVITERRTPKADLLPDRETDRRAASPMINAKRTRRSGRAASSEIAFPFWRKIAIMGLRAFTSGNYRGWRRHFLYHRVSTNVQDTKEQVKGNRQYAQENGITVLNEYGDFGKRHHAHKRPNFQRMLADIATMKPDLILVQRLDRFGVKDANELGYFLTILEKSNVRLITTIDGQDHSKDDIATSITNTIAASQSRQEQIDKADRVLVGKRKTASQGEYIGGKYLTYGFDLVCIGRDGNEKWRLVEESYDCRIKYVLVGRAIPRSRAIRQRGS